ncbi:MAG: hypothetical protein ON057_001566 [Glomeribacter sp. 1016415]|nr:hypothetical protein [Glomeribacter sp. 1016415]
MSNTNTHLAYALGRTSLFQDTSFFQDSSQALAFLTGQLESVETQIYQKKRAPLDYEALLPISTSAGQWATSITYRMKDFAGQGKRHSGKGGDIPRVDVWYSEKTIPVVSAAIGYSYTFDELRKAAKLNLALDQDRAETAFYAYRAHLNQVGLFGEEELTGLFNSPVVPQAQAGTGTWSTATPEQILKDINDAISQVWIQTRRNSTANTIILPGSHYSLLASTPRSKGSDKTLLQYVRENNIAKAERNIDIDFRGGLDLDRAGQNQSTRMMVYEKDKINLAFHIPMPLMFHTPEQRGLELLVNGEYKYSGVEFRYPKSALYIDGI